MTKVADLISVRTIAKLCEVSHVSAWQWCRDGLIKEAQQVDGHFWVASKTAVQEFMAERLLRKKDA